MLAIGELLLQEPYTLAALFGVGQGYRIGSGCVGMHVDVDLVEAGGGRTREARQDIAAEVADLDGIAGRGGCTEEEAGAADGRVRIGPAEGEVGDHRYFDNGAVGEVSAEILHPEAIEIITGVGARIGKSVLVLAGGVLGIDGADRIKDIAVGAALDDELPGSDLVGGLPLQADLISLG